MHLSVLGMGLYQVLRRVHVPEWLRVAGSVLVISLYGVMIHAGVSTIRAILMFTIYLCGRLLGRTYDMGVALAVAACVIVTGNAAALTSAGFLFSFLSVLALLFFYPFLKRLLPLWEKWEPYPLLCRGWDLFLASFSITFFLLPVQLYYYYELYPYALLLNLIVLPLFPVVLYSGFAGGIVGMFFPFGGKLLLLPCTCIFRFYQWVCDKTELLPANQVIVGKPSPVQILVFYILILGVIGFTNYTRKGERGSTEYRKDCVTDFAEGMRKGERGFTEYREDCVTDFANDIRNGEMEIGSKGKATFPILVCLVACILLCVRIRWNTSITFLDVGQGDCCVIRQKSGINILIDAGSSDVADCGERRLIPFLKAEGISRIDYAFISHPDKDHCSALMECVGAEGETGIRIEKLVLSMYGRKDEAYEEILERGKSATKEIVYMGPGDAMIVGDEETTLFSLRCLFPQGDEQFAETNDQSLVLFLQEGDFTMLFTGDMGQKAEQVFLDFYSNGQCGNPCGEIDVLKVAHHGSATSTGKEFLQYIKPKVAVISCGADNPYGHPHKESLEHLKEAGAKVLRTDASGAIEIRLEGEKTVISGYGSKK